MRFMTDLDISECAPSDVVALYIPSAATAILVDPHTKTAIAKMNATDDALKLMNFRVVTLEAPPERAPSTLHGTAGQRANAATFTYSISHHKYGRAEIEDALPSLDPTDISKLHETLQKREWGIQYNGDNTEATCHDGTVISIGNTLSGSKKTNRKKLLAWCARKYYAACFAEYGITSGLVDMSTMHRPRKTSRTASSVDAYIVNDFRWDQLALSAVPLKLYVHIAYRNFKSHEVEAIGVMDEKNNVLIYHASRAKSENEYPDVLRSIMYSPQVTKLCFDELQHVKVAIGAALDMAADDVRGFSNVAQHMQDLGLPSSKLEDHYAAERWRQIASVFGGIRVQKGGFTNVVTIGDWVFHQATPLFEGRKHDRALSQLAREHISKALLLTQTVGDNVERLHAKRDEIFHNIVKHIRDASAVTTVRVSDAEPSRASLTPPPLYHASAQDRKRKAHDQNPAGSTAPCGQMPRWDE
jgi:hypothetical protein